MNNEDFGKMEELKIKMLNLLLDSGLSSYKQFLIANQVTRETVAMASDKMDN